MNTYIHVKRLDDSFWWNYGVLRDINNIDEAKLACENIYNNGLKLYEDWNNVDVVRFRIITDTTVFEGNYSTETGWEDIRTIGKMYLEEL